jgi:hypothetical protein
VAAAATVAAVAAAIGVMVSAIGEDSGRPPTIRAATAAATRTRAGLAHAREAAPALARHGDGNAERERPRVSSNDDEARRKASTWRGTECVLLLASCGPRSGHSSVCAQSPQAKN